MSTYQDFRDNAWISGLFRPILIAVLAASLVAGPLAILRAIVPWRLGYILPLVFVVALEGVYTTNQLGRPSWRDRRGVLLRLGELSLLAGALRLVIWLFSTGLPGWADLGLWLRHPGSFFDDQFLISGSLMLMAWGLAIGIASDFLELAIQADEVAARASRNSHESSSQWRVFRPVSRDTIVIRFATRWGWGSLVLVFFAAISRITLTGGFSTQPLKFGLAQLGLPTDILVALLGYFLSGLLLMSQARLAVLRGRWYNQDIDVQPTVLRRWHLTSLLVLLLVAGLAALLPIGSTNWLSIALYHAIAFLTRIAYFIMLLLIFMLSALLAPLRALFGWQQTAVSPPPPPKMPGQVQVSNQLPEWLGGAVLWVIVGVIVGYFLLNYFRAQDLFKGRWLAWLERLRGWWQARWFRLSTSAQAITVALRSRLRPHRPEVSVKRRHFIRLSTLAPREKIRYFYLRTVRQAADHGLIRPPHRTPLEFADDLEDHWPNAEIDLKDLTEAFLAARYDRRAIEEAEARGVQSIWRKVMRALRSRAQ